MSILKYKCNLFLLLVLLAVACKKQEDVLMKGHVVIRAEKKFPMGMIRVHLFENKDPFYEEPIRGIMYHYDSTNVINLGDTVVFRVRQNDKWQWAEGVTKYDQQPIGTAKQRFSVVKKLLINLHLADSNHREGPFHKFGHIRSSRVLDGTGYTKIRVLFNTTDPGITDTADYVISNIYFPKDTSIGYFFGVIDTIIIADTLRKMAEITPEHTHTYGPH
ncbi:MAG: hypothetical protein IPH94_03385 [Saprospiraceae bacterium]|nr:hypothetical protein [Saprospiraceae bacterium]MBK8109574.1 hypothetical protein [Saprospiraceae bacterium]